MVIPSEVFYVGNMSSLRNTTVRVRSNCRCHQPQTNSRDHADVNRRKAEDTRDILAEFRWTIRVVLASPAIFLMSATCYLFEKRWCESVITAVAVSRGACRHRLHFAISRKIHNFATFILPSIFRSSISHFALYQHPPPDGPARTSS